MPCYCWHCLTKAYFDVRAVRAQFCILKSRKYSSEAKLYLWCKYEIGGPSRQNAKLQQDEGRRLCVHIIDAWYSNTVFCCCLHSPKDHRIISWVYMYRNNCISCFYIIYLMQLIVNLIMFVYMFYVCAAWTFIPVLLNDKLSQMPFSSQIWTWNLLHSYWRCLPKNEATGLNRNSERYSKKIVQVSKHWMLSVSSKRRSTSYRPNTGTRGHQSNFILVIKKDIPIINHDRKIQL